MLVMKFGGTSVKDAEAIRRLTQIVARARTAATRPHAAVRGPVVVVSALSKVTDALLAVSARAASGEPPINDLEALRERHHLVAEGVVRNEERLAALKAAIDADLAELTALLHALAVVHDVAPRLMDAVAAIGELLSSRIVAAALEQTGLPASWVDARTVLVTDAEIPASPLMDETRARCEQVLLPLIARGRVPVLGGFIGATAGGVTTTLGRGGSDYSAALVAAALHAKELQIWTDVTGVMTCDPRICSDARTIPVLSYDEAAELAYFGAKVLHPKTIKPAVDYKIPVRVCNTFEPDAIGTMVLAESGEVPNKIKSIAHKKNITILRITSARMLGSYGFMSAVFQVFDRHRTVIDVISTSEVSVALTLDKTDSLDSVVAELERFGEVEVESGYAVICVVGEGLRASTGLASKIFSTIEDISIALVSHGASSVNLTFVVKEDEAANVIKKLHDEFF